MNTTTPTVDPTPFDDGALYDLFLGNIELGLDFYTGLAKAAKGPVLDVACGTGRILLPCLQAGVDIEGLDFFAGMLNQLRQKAGALGFKPVLHQFDMSSFRLARRYALIIIPFNAFAHNLTTDTQLSCLRACREHLQPGCDRQGHCLLSFKNDGALDVQARDGTVAAWVRSGSLGNSRQFRRKTARAGNRCDDREGLGRRIGERCRRLTTKLQVLPI
jgi:SAM-dependent methyltransferase